MDNQPLRGVAAPLGVSEYRQHPKRNLAIIVLAVAAAKREPAAPVKIQIAFDAICNSQMGFAGAVNFQKKTALRFALADEKKAKLTTATTTRGENRGLLQYSQRARRGSNPQPPDRQSGTLAN